MYKKMVALQGNLKGEKEQLEEEIKQLKSDSQHANLVLFDENLAASRITQAQTNDQLNGQETAKALIKEIDKERESLLKANADINLKADTAKQLLPAKEARLLSVNNEINKIGWEITELITQEANKRLKAKTKKYRRLAIDLLNTLIEIDALNAVIGESPQDNPAKLVLKISSLPAANLDDFDKLQPWRWQPSGEKLIFPRQSAFTAVNEKHQLIKEEIKGYLNGK